MARPTTTFSLESQPEVFFTTTAASRAIRRLLGQGKVRHIEGRLYTRNLTDPVEEVVRRRAWDVAAGYFPGAVVVDRTAFAMRPSGDEGSVFLSSDTARVVRLPGLVLNCRRGPGPVEGDQPFMGGGLHLSSWSRRFLDNMRPARARAGSRRTLTQAEIEQKLQEILVNQGEAELNRLRDEAARVAPPLDAADQLERLRDLIGTLLGTRDAPLATERARATAQGKGWDEARLPLFDTLMAAVHERVPVLRPERPGHTGSPFAFYEAYFSNFIEGTEFTLEEAEDIVFHGAMPAERPQDAHDVLGTFDLVSDPAMRARTPTSADDLEAVIRGLNARIVAARPELRPGEYKRRPNRAGNTYFVAPTEVAGTLRRGYEGYAALAPGFPRAVFAMFLVAEVHPFADGNGRVARALANAELSAAGQQRLMVPIVLRDDYMHALRALSRQADPDPLIRVLDRAQQWAYEIDWSDMTTARAALERTNALLTSSEADEAGVVLRLPSELQAR
jgi:Fic/DOC family